MNEHIFDTFDRSILLRSAQKYTNNNEDLEDYTQQALLNAWERRKDIESLSQYLRMSIKSLHKLTIKEVKYHLDYIRYQQNRHQHARDAAYALQLKAFSEKAERLIAQLSPTYRKTLKYRLLDYSIEKIAKVMHVKEGTVMSRLHSIRKKLQLELAEYSDLI